MRRWLGILLLLCGLTLPVEADVAFVAATSGTTTASSTSLTYTHTVSAGANRFLEVGVTIDDEFVTVSSVTFNGDALAFKCREAHTTQGITVEKWYLVNPDVATGNVVVTISGAEGFVSGAMSMTGVDQANPYRGACVTTEVDGTGTTISVNVPSAAGDLVTDVGGAALNEAGTPGAGQTERWDDNSKNVNLVRSFASTEAGGATVTMSWTTGTTQFMVLAGASIQAHVDGAAVTRGRRILIVQ